MAQILAAANEMGQARDHILQAEHLATDDAMRDKVDAARRSFDDNG
jgi:hypothetical protein